MEQLKLYARQEPADDDLLRKYAPNEKRFDTVFYRDRACTDVYARWAWHVSGRPVRRKSVSLNCYNWRIEWV